MKCLTCDREFTRIGMAQHMAAHRRRKEKCSILNNGRVETYRFGRVAMKHLKYVKPKKISISDEYCGYK